MTSQPYDLDLDSYSLQDLLGLFKVELPLTDIAVSNARRRAFMTHPDKSGLNRDVFIFFKAAYDKLESLYGIQERQTREAAEVYETDLEDRNIGLENFAKSRDFGAHFNKLFEECVAGPARSSGHGEWLSATEDRVDKSSRSDMETKKKEQRELCIVREVEGVGSGIGTALLEEGDIGRGTGGLRYDDLRKAYTETLIPVTEEEDFLKRERFGSVDELRTKRQRDINVESFAGHERQLAADRRAANMQDVQMAYNLQKFDTRMREARKSAETRLLQIRGK